MARSALPLTGIFLPHPLNATDLDSEPIPSPPEPEPESATPEPEPELEAPPQPAKVKVTTPAPTHHLLQDELDRPTIGIVLCRSKSRTIVEFAFGSVQNPIGGATYHLRDDLPPELQESLPTVKQLEMEVDGAIADLEPGEYRARGQG